MRRQAILIVSVLLDFMRRGGRAVECGGLESHCALLGTGGSNPLPSAIKKRNPLLTQRVFLWLANCKKHNWRCLCYAKIQRKTFLCLFARKATEGRGSLRPDCMGVVSSGLGILSSPPCNMKKTLSFFWKAEVQ